MNRGFIGALCLSVAIAGCDGQQNTVQTAPMAGIPAVNGTTAAAGAKAKATDLVYDSSSALYTYVLTYPKGKLVATIKDPNALYQQGLCSDSRGNVFVTSSTNDHHGYISEYAHGGTTPIATLDDASFWPQACSLDPKSGNLAVANVGGAAHSYGNIAIYDGASGAPVYISNPTMNEYNAAAYDADGNLFVTNSSSVAELPYGSSAFVDLQLSENVGVMNDLQWDGSYLAIFSHRFGSDKAAFISQVSVAGSVATVISSHKLDKIKNSSAWVWIHGSTLFGPYGAASRNLGFWRYPTGGKPYKNVNIDGNASVYHGITVSVAPHP